jgi:RNA polymerase sigma factor (sigma-70 family)
MADLKNIISDCRKNDRRSQKALYDLFYGYALTVALPYCRHQADAREVVNDAFLKVFVGLDKYDLQQPFKSWFRVIVVRSAINYYHKYIEKLPLSDFSEAEIIGFEDDFIEKMTSDEVLNLLQQLSPSYRLVFNLFVFEGYSHPEIAELLGISVGASKSNLFKAKKQLKVLLKDINIYKND